MMLYYLSMILFFMFSLLFFILGLNLLFNLKIYFFEWNLIFINSVSMNMYLFIDWMALMFMFVVMMISSMIFLYCCEYMESDLNKSRFFYLVFFFIISMLLMIVSPSMVSIILGWDGLGLISYCLVIFYQNYFSYNSGMLTVLMNRIGDIMIMMTISLMFIYGSWNFMNLNNYSSLMLFLLVIASFTKSAQYPFSSWLPAAMAAPTPVSSLVHSSTLVTAGVYLLIRFNYLIYLNYNLMFFIMSIGMLTMMFAGFSANFEYDLKKIIAYSTLSQLGLMMLIYSMKFYMLAFFHLLIHAMFKSMMFMCSGIFIHSMNNFQDIRFMGNLKEFMPLTVIFFMISNFSLCGMPFFSGFYSKDLILEKIFMSKFYFMMFVFLLVSTMLTVFYSFRLLKFLLNKNFYFFSFYKIEDSKIMNFSMIILMFNSLFMGMYMNWLIFMNIEEIYLMVNEKILILILCILSVLLINFFFKMKNSSFMVFFFGKMWLLYYMNFLLNIFLLSKMNYYYYYYDKGLIKYVFKGYLFVVLMIMKINLLNKNYMIFLIFMMSIFFFFILFI
uniref:NADH dehydrogenase subunit 5 n=1 Tax=Anagyrus jenniferae TaxID=2058195 RepID=UPI002E78F7A2|nr:NADH dehydrogenase subunit 5 [Anagyrus jenniferae]WPT46948.1 NADH dehydrogenase subunit 5 [Anagyrus jenniferae]